MAKKIEEVKDEAKVIEEAKELVPEAEAKVEAGATDETQEVEKKGFFAGVKKHGGKVVAGTIAAIVGTVAVFKILSGKQADSEDIDESSEDVAEETE